MTIKPPKIDNRKFGDLYKRLKAFAPHYTPEWTAADKKDAGGVLLKIFSHIAETVISRLNQAPRKNFVAFLDMLGIELLPARPARVPLTFKLAKGTEKEILIPPRTQAEADKTEEHDALPFETEKNLLAIPSALKKAISVDPSKDAIYVPPPDFLEGTIQEKTALVYRVVSSPSAGAKDFQFDHVTDLEAGDFLKIEHGVGMSGIAAADNCLCSTAEKSNGGTVAEYVIVSDVSGNIVSIEGKLSHGYAVGTAVAKVSKFNLFEGKNLQEHGLYIGHKDLFNVKSIAQFTLYITQLAGTQAGVDPLKLAWEYWGELKGEEGEGWRTFKTIDTTQGLSQAGKIELTKVAEGEIKEKEINSVKSRWIRCQVDEPLPVNVSRKLPVLNNLTFEVKAFGEKLLPDQVFNNDIPLDISKPFSPFGKEPRIFDHFSIANQEAFSKKGAKVTVDVDVEPRGILGPPVAIKIIDSDQQEKIKVFASGTYGRLMEVEIDPTGEEEPAWKDHGFPLETIIAAKSTPSAVPESTAETGFISVFARAKNGHLVERFFNGTQWQWIDHDVPTSGGTIAFDPCAIIWNRKISVFVTGTDGSLYEFNRQPNTTVGSWLLRGRPDDELIDSSPYADGYIKEGYSYGKIKIFVKGEKGKLYEWNVGERWIDYKSPSTTTVDSRPFARVSGGGSCAIVYVKGLDSRLWAFDSKSGEWEKLTEEKAIKSNPHGCILFNYEDETPDLIYIFARDIDGNLLEWNKDGENVENVNHHSPANKKLRFSPFVLLTDNNEVLRIFSNCNQDSILQRVSNTEKIWNEYQDPYESALTPTLSWEYWNKKGWLVLKGLQDGTANFLKNGKITFNLPKDIEETEIAGQKSYWIRARIVGGDYGRETFTVAYDLTAKTRLGINFPEQKLISSKDSIRPPLINSLTITYESLTKEFPQKCLTYNNLEYLDQAASCKDADKHFTPFALLEAKEKTLYLGFDKSFKGGPAKIFFAAKEIPFTERPKLEWTYSAKDEWKALSYLDATEGLVRREILEFLGPSGFAAFSRFGNYLYWIKGGLKEGEYEKDPVLDGIYPNTTWAFQAGTFKDEILGSSTGEANQAFSFLKFPVFDGEEVRVREILSEEEKQLIITEVENQKISDSLRKKAICEVKDAKGKVTETWVLWQKIFDFFDSDETSRHYTLDRATGEIRFGDGINGMAPAAGDNNIKVFSYQAGGGVKGNVDALAIKTLKSAVAGVDKVSNPIAADGGADTATVDQMLEIGPALISHRDRAVTPEDFEWLAKEASRKVVKARCLPNTNNKITMGNERVSETGWVTVIIVPDSQEEKPTPSLELKRVVQKYLEARCAGTLASMKHVYVDGPFYTAVDVTVDLFVNSIDVASKVEREARSKLDAFFHPLTGGQDGKGWAFGRDISASDVYALLEDISDVDHLENLKFSSESTTAEEVVEIKRNFLVANGKHEINVQPVNGR